MKKLLIALYAAACLAVAAWAPVTEAATVLLPVRILPNGGSSTISLNIVVPHSTVIARSGVFFNATGTTDSATSNPFRDVAYTWDFADDRSTFWPYGSNAGSNNKNVAEGATVAHVFDTPGTYVVNLRGDNAAGNTSTTTTITVQDPDVVFSGTNTVCVGATSTGCPAGATYSATVTCANYIGSGGAGKRVLIQRGSAVTCSATMQIGSGVKQHFGAYGTGACPSFTYSGGDVIAFSSSSASEVAIYDICLDGGSGSGNTGVMAGGGIHPSQVTVNNVDMQHMGRGAVEWDGPEWVVSEVTATNFVGAVAIPFFIQQNGTGAGPWSYSSVIGSYGNISNNGGFETLRSPFCRFCYISNNKLVSNDNTKPSGASFAAVKLHNPSNGGPIWGGTCSEYNVFSWNWVEEAVSSVLAEFTPQNDISNEHLCDWVIERNYFYGKSASNTEVQIQGVRMTFRDNICRSNNSTVGCFWIYRRSSVAPAPDDIVVNNNTFYYTSTAGFIAVNLFNFGTSTQETTNITAKNNLCRAPSSGGAVMVQGAFTSSSNNSSNANCRSGGANPGFATTPLVPIDFKCTTAACSANGTAALNPGVLSDFFKINYSLPMPIGAVAP